MSYVRRVRVPRIAACQRPAPCAALSLVEMMVAVALTTIILGMAITLAVDLQPGTGSFETTMSIASS